MTTTDFYSIKFQNVSNKIIVKTDGEFEMPSIYDAVDQLNEKWLEKQLRAHGVKTAGDVYLMTVNDAGEIYFAAKERKNET